MTWSPDTSNGFESDKIAAIAAQYLQGKALDIGCGLRKVWPSLIGVDDCSTFKHHTKSDVDCDMRELPFKDGWADAIFSSHALEDRPREDMLPILTEWARVLKPGGNLVLYVPSANLYPKMGTEGANSGHMQDIYPGDIEAVLKQIPDCGWELLESEERNEGDEYSLFVVARKVGVPCWIENVWQRNPDGKKRCLLIRYGAIGDQIMASSVLPGLKKQGYYVTYNTSPESWGVLINNPHIDEYLIQAKNFVPNEQLGAYWLALGKRYDKVINLSESIEAGLLTLPGRTVHNYPDSLRRKAFGGVNYLERTHDIAEVPCDEFDARFYPTHDEDSGARDWVRGLNGPVVMLALSGTSCHKTWPYAQVLTRWLLDLTPAHVVLIGHGEADEILQDGLVAAAKVPVDHPRLHRMVGQWKIRKTLAIARHCHVVVGPETGVLNAVGMEDNRKVIYLSHSSAENLTKHWKNTVTLTPSAEMAPCFPCHRMHYTWDWCHKDEKTNAALCAMGISPESVFEHVVEAFLVKKPTLPAKLAAD